jgi:hypothetical protein
MAFSTAERIMECYHAAFADELAATVTMITYNDRHYSTSKREEAPPLRIGEPAGLSFLSAVFEVGVWISCCQEVAMSFL